MPYIGNPIYQSAFVTDSFSGTGSQTAYTMSVAPAGTTNVLIAVSGVLQDPSTYGVVGNTLNFTTAPPSGTANISVRYLGIPVTGVTTTAYRTKTEFTATAGQTTFTPPSYTVGYIDVFRNGVLLGSADYTASNGTTVVLTTGATSGDLITTESFYVSSVLNAIPNTAGSVGSANIAGGAVGSAQLGSLTTLPVSGGYTATLPSATGTVMVSGNQPTFSAYPNSAQGISSASNTILAYNTIIANLGGCYNNTSGTVTLNGLSVPAYSFCPNVAGYYQISATCAVYGQTSSGGYISMYLQKNGTAYGANLIPLIANIETILSASCLIYLNGTGDYFNAKAYQTSGISLTMDAGTFANFSAVLVRTT